MPIIIPKFGERTVVSESKNVKIKYIFAFEGNKTELQYFQGIKNESKDININDLVEIIPLERDEDDTKSHPSRVLDGLLEKIESFSSEHYDKEIDKVYIVVDRDRQSFKSFQYIPFYEKCCENNISIGLTNPCFELWLLCHLEDFATHDKEELYKNRKTGKKRFIEKKLAEKLGSYNKEKIDFSKFKDNINNAILNEKTLEQDYQKMKDALGSNIGLIIEDMMKKSN